MSIFAKRPTVLMLLLSSAYALNCQAGTATWLPVWSDAPQAPFSSGISHDGLNNQSVRMIIHSHYQGEAARLHFSNRFGDKPVLLSQVTLARSVDGAAIDAHSLKTVTFNHGLKQIELLPGSEVISDEIAEPVKAEQNLAVSVYVQQPSGPISWHEDASQTSYLSADNQTQNTSAKPYTDKMSSWFWLSGMDLLSADNNHGSIITFGDSITDGHRSTPDTNHRWPDYFAERINQQFGNGYFVVLNQGISGNRILQDTDKFGVSALARLDEDVLAKNNVKTVIFLEGINDIGHGNFNSASIIQGMEQISAQLHAHHIRMLAGTLLPFKGAKYDTPQGQQTRHEVNTWIRTSKDIDGVIDFAKVVQSPTDPLQLAAQYDSGDHLHPNDAGYQKMASLVPLSAL